MNSSGTSERTARRASRPFGRSPRPSGPPRRCASLLDSAGVHRLVVAYGAVPGSDGQIPYTRQAPMPFQGLAHECARRAGVGVSRCERPRRRRRGHMEWTVVRVRIRHRADDRPTWPPVPGALQIVFSSVPPPFLKGVESMRANLIPLVLALTVAVTLSAHAGPPAPPLVKFGGAIGVDPLTAAGGVDVLNIVRGISPGGRAWVQRKLRATVGTDGHIDVQGAGLLLASVKALRPEPRSRTLRQRWPVVRPTAPPPCSPRPRARSTWRVTSTSPVRSARTA